MTWKHKEFTAYKPVYGHFTQPEVSCRISHLFPFANSFPDMVIVGILHCVYVRMFSVYALLYQFTLLY